MRAHLCLNTATPPGHRVETSTHPCFRDKRRTYPAESQPRFAAREWKADFRRSRDRGASRAQTNSPTSRHLGRGAGRAPTHWRSHDRSSTDRGLYRFTVAFAYRYDQVCSKSFLHERKPSPLIQGFLYICARGTIGVRVPDIYAGGWIDDHEGRPGAEDIRRRNCLFLAEARAEQRMIAVTARSLRRSIAALLLRVKSTPR